MQMTLVSPKQFNAAVVGAGPAGLAVVARLLDLAHKSSKPYTILWIDPSYQGGRLAAYKEVPSNTKVKLFLKFVHVSNSLNSAFLQSPKLVSHLNSMDQESGCPLVNAQQLTCELASNLKQTYKENILAVQGQVTNIQFSNDQYTVSIKTAASDDAVLQNMTASDLYLCTGSHPVVGQFHLLPEIKNKVQVLDLDICLNPTKLENVVHSFQNTNPTTNVRVAVIGSSHSAVLCLMNLSQLNVSIVNVYRNAFKYAKEIKSETNPSLDYILYDNTGLKGTAATFAQSFLEDQATLAKLNITRVLAPELDQQDQFYQDLCTQDPITHIVYSIGYKSSPTPAVSVNGQQVHNLIHDPLTGYLSCAHTQINIPRLRGFGIAFPERVVDPLGNVEFSVGMWKFQRYIQKVIQLV